MPRGIYALEDEEAPWLKERLVFASKDECSAWMQKNVDDQDHPSNPVVPHLNHIFTFLTSWGEVEEFLLKKIDEYDQRFPPTKPLAPISPQNRFLAAQSPQGTPGASLGSAEETDGAEGSGVAAAVRARLNLSVHRRLNRAATRNTLSYLFNHMRCGIYVMIRAGKMRMFVPFVNAAYTNTWASALKWYAPAAPGTAAASSSSSSSSGSAAASSSSSSAEGGGGGGGGATLLDQDIRGYYDEKEKRGSRPENVIENVGEWWANGNIICNEHCPPGETQSQYWGDQLLVPLRDMLHTLCEERPNIPDCEFFINKRDYPHLKVHSFKDEDDDEEEEEEVEAVAVEPYGFIYDCDDRNPAHDVPLSREQHGDSYAPIASFYCSSPDRFADLPLPTSEDWEAATGEVFPPSFKREWDHKTQTLKFDNIRDLFTEENFRKFDCAWEAKRETALFRGTATGGGVTEDTNQRIKCAALRCRLLATRCRLLATRCRLLATRCRLVATTTTRRTKR